MRSDGIAATFKATNDPLARGEWRCSALATSSLPAPEGPLINTDTLEADNLPMARKTSCIAGA